MKKMPDKIMAILAEVTGGKSYKAHKYGLDHADRPFIDYGEDSIIWKKTAETDKSNRKYVPLEVLSKTLSAREEQRLTYFLDGSRRVFKVDDIAYTKSGGRSAIYPVVAGQIGVGCCKRENKRLIPEKFKREFVLSIPDIANADGKAGFFPATARKLNESPELKRLGIEFATIIPYRTAKNAEKKFEDLGTACIQDRMSQREKELVAELVREGKLNQDNYLVKDGSLEYRPTKEDKADKRKYQIFKNNYNWVLGVSKNFNPEVCVDINGKPNPGFIADLPLYHRTPVACFKNPDWFGDTEFAVWYINTWEGFREKVDELSQKSQTQGRGTQRNSNEISVLSWRKFKRIVNKAIKNDDMFANRADSSRHECRLADAIKHISNNDVYVIDVAKLTEDKQAFVFGDAVRTIYNLKLGEYDGESGINPPSRIIVFIDELNKYASKDTPKYSPILQEILDVTERGRSLGVVLFGAEQFRSNIHQRVTGNCSTHAYGRTNSIETSTKDYSSLPSTYKNMLTRLEQGDYLIQNPIFRSLLKIRFPKPIYKQFKK